MMSFDESPDPLPQGFFQAFRGEAEPGGELSLDAIRPRLPLR